MSSKKEDRSRMASDWLRKKLQESLPVEESFVGMMKFVEFKERLDVPYTFIFGADFCGADERDLKVSGGVACDNGLYRAMPVFEQEGGKGGVYALTPVSSGEDKSIRPCESSMGKLDLAWFKSYYEECMDHYVGEVEEPHQHDPVRLDKHPFEIDMGFLTAHYDEEVRKLRQQESTMSENKDGFRPNFSIKKESPLTVLQDAHVEHVTFESIEVDDDGPGYKHHVCESCGSITGCMCPRPKKEEMVKKRLLRGHSNASRMLRVLGYAEDVARGVGDAKTLSALSALIKEVARKSEASDIDLGR